MRALGVLDLRSVSNAAKLRLILTEANLHKSNLQNKVREEWQKGEHFLQGDNFQGNHPWRRWYREGILASIYEAEDLLQKRNITKADILQKGTSCTARAGVEEAETQPSENCHGDAGGGGQEGGAGVAEAVRKMGTAFLRKTPCRQGGIPHPYHLPALPAQSGGYLTSGVAQWVDNLKKNEGLHRYLRMQDLWEAGRRKY